MVEEIKSKPNVSKILVNSNLPFNNGVNDDKQTSTLKNLRINHRQKYVCHILIQT